MILSKIVHETLNDFQFYKACKFTIRSMCALLSGIAKKTSELAKTFLDEHEHLNYETFIIDFVKSVVSITILYDFLYVHAHITY